MEDEEEDEEGDDEEEDKEEEETESLTQHRNARHLTVPGTVPEGSRQDSCLQGACVLT